MGLPTTKNPNQAQVTPDWTYRYTTWFVGRSATCSVVRKSRNWCSRTIRNRHVGQGGRRRKGRIGRVGVRGSERKAGYRRGWAWCSERGWISLSTRYRMASDGHTEGKVADDAPSKDSLAYIQLEKQNERLKEALIKYACPLPYILFAYFSQTSWHDSGNRPRSTTKNNRNGKRCCELWGFTR